MHTLKQIKSLISIYEHTTEVRACLTTHQSVLIKINILDHRWGTTSFPVAEENVQIPFRGYLRPMIHLHDFQIRLFTQQWPGARTEVLAAFLSITASPGWAGPWEHSGGGAVAARMQPSVLPSWGAARSLRPGQRTAAQGLGGSRAFVKLTLVSSWGMANSDPKSHPARRLGA